MVCALTLVVGRWTAASGIWVVRVKLALLHLMMVMLSGMLIRCLTRVVMMFTVRTLPVVKMLLGCLPMLWSVTIVLVLTFFPMKHADVMTLLYVRLSCL